MNIHKYILCILFVFSFNLYCIPSVRVNDNFYRVSSVNDGITDIKDISYEDYSMNLNTIGFPMLSTFFKIEDKLPVLSILLELYEFVGYDKNVETLVTHLNFFRTLKTIEWYFSDNNKNLSVSFSYSSTMNVNYNSMIRDLSASYSKFYIDTNVLLSIHFYL